MGRWIVIAGMLVASPAAAQTLEQLQNRQSLERSQRELQTDAARRSTGTTATIGNRVERLDLQRQLQTERAMPTLRPQPSLPLR